MDVSSCFAYYALIFLMIFICVPLRRLVPRVKILVPPNRKIVSQKGMPKM